MRSQVRALLAFLGFFVVTGILMSDRFEDIRHAIPESLSYYLFVGIVAAMIVVGLHSWWQRYSGRTPDPTVSRLKSWIEDTPWWLWPFS
jgi:hypothetical protein